MNPRERGGLVDALGSALSSGSAALGDVPGLLQRVLRDEAWRDFETQLHEHVTYRRFEDFVRTPPLKGLGADIGIVRRLAQDDPVTMDLLDQALQRDTTEPRLTVDNVNGYSRPDGNSVEQALRRLRAQRPDLHAQVLSGELSPHRAMVEAGFRHPTVTVPLDDVDRLARTLRKHLGAAQLHDLVRSLSE